MENLPDDSTEFLGLFDKSNAKSVYNRVPKSMRLAMENIPPHLHYKGERYLKREAKPPPKLKNARVQFWLLFAAHPTAPIKMVDVFNHSRAPYYEMLEKPKRLMWFLTPPDDAMDTQRVMLTEALEILQSALNEDNLFTTRVKSKEKKDGTVEREEVKELNVRAVGELRRLAGDLQDRLTGSTNIKVGKAVMLNGQGGFNQLSGADILDVAMGSNAAPPPKVLEPYVEEPKEPMFLFDKTADLSEFMHEEGVVFEDE